ncbi:glutamate racemase, partial [Ralstonia pseudosolanacearum]
AAASPRFLSTADVLPLQAMVAALLGEAPMAQRIDIGDIGDTAVPPLASHQ